MATLPDALRLGAVHLAVADADRAEGFYRDALGLQVHGRVEGAVALGAGAGDLVVLHEEPGARPAGRHGLFHVALLTPHLGRRGRRPRAAGQRRPAPLDDRPGRRRSARRRA